MTTALSNDELDMLASDTSGLDRLRAILRPMKSVAVAFSGGADSTFLLAVAAQELGDRVVAVSAASPAFPAREQAEARAFCAERGIEHVVLPSTELDVPGYRDNSPQRCYLCKTAIFGALWDYVRGRGIEMLVDGTNLDDEGDYRPGMKALDELGVVSPLRAAGLTKAQVRAYSRAMGLATWNKPSCACLASRFPYGERIEPDLLVRVDAAEEYLHDIGLSQVRVRVHGKTLARIEVVPEEFALVTGDAMREAIVSTFKGLGFAYVALDLVGYRSGSMNEVLAER